MSTELNEAFMVRSSMMREVIMGCPLRARLDSLTEDEHTTPTGWFILGTEVHDVIYEHLTEVLTEDELHEELERRLTQAFDSESGIVYSKARPTPEANIEAAHEILDNYLDLRANHPLFKCVDLAEAELLMESETDGAFSTLDSLFVVKDHVAAQDLQFFFGRDDLEYIIVDWKTGSSASAQPAQLWFYYWLARKTGVIPKDTPFAGAFVHLTHGRIEPVTFYPGDRTIETWKTVVQELEATGLWYPRPGWYCRLCSHHYVCPIIEKEK